MNKFSLEYARHQDTHDKLASFRGKFHIPKTKSGDEAVYLCGNSLGLQPKITKSVVNQELEDWAQLGVEGHFKSNNPWLSFHKPLSLPMSNLLGAKESEVVMMNTLTANLHLLLVSFYRPNKTKHKILCEHKPFPSDRFVFASQIRFHGFDPDEALLEVARNEELITTEETIIKTIEENHHEIALVCLGAVNYYTGQVFDISRIARVAQEYKIPFGLDLAHAAGNVKLQLHENQVDFAAWCTYKYLNSGPGAIAGLYVHQKHHSSASIPRFEGWWGHQESTRFEMGNEFIPENSAEAWSLSNPPILSMAAVKASLSVFSEAGFEQLQSKARKLTSYCRGLIEEEFSEEIKIITPEQTQGCQLSLQFKNRDTRQCFDFLTKHGVICDYREPDTIRIAPVPLYNSFTDIFRFCQILQQSMRLG